MYPNSPDIRLTRVDFGPLSAAIMPAFRGLRAQRGHGRRLSQYTTDVLSGKKPPCVVLDRFMAEAVADPYVSTYGLLHVPARMRWWILGSRGLLLSTCLYEASARETDAVAALDPLQHRLLRNGLHNASLSDLYAVVPYVSAQVEASEMLQVAVLTEIAQREQQARRTA